MSLCDMSPDDLVLLATIIGTLLSKDMTLDEQNLWGNFLQAIGQTILVINAKLTLEQDALQNAQEQNNNNQASNMSKEIELLKNRISQLEKELRKDNS